MAASCAWTVGLRAQETVIYGLKFQRRVKMILDISQLQHHVSRRKSEFVRDKAIAPHRARRFSLSDRAAPERPVPSYDL